MFDKFGEFGSAEELNRAAAAQLAEKTIRRLVIWRLRTVLRQRMWMII